MNFSRTCKSSVTGLMLLLCSTAFAADGLAKKKVLPETASMVSRLVVKYKNETTQTQKFGIASDRMGALASLAGMRLKYQRPMSGLAHVVEFERALSSAEARALAVRIARDPSVEYAEPDVWVQSALTPNDPEYISNKQWHYLAPSGAQRGGANLPTAWDRTRGANIVVAVIDTGVVSHPDLSANVIAGYDFVSNAFVGNDGNGRDSNPTDPGDGYSAGECTKISGNPGSQGNTWHGTHVSGTVAALTNNTIGVAGVAYEAKVLNVRALGRCGGELTDIADAIRWAAGGTVAEVPALPIANRAKVINLSLGGNSPTCPTYMQDAVTYAISQGAVVVAAAGNSSADLAKFVPANCAGVIAVTAHTYEGDNADYANFGPLTSISAPGGTTINNACNTLSGCIANPVWSTLNAGTYAGKEGTSMAAPHVAGVAALVLSANSSRTPAQIKSILETSARPHPAGTFCANALLTGLCGSGLLDAANATANSSTPIVTASTSVAAGSFAQNGTTVNLSCAAQEQNSAVGTYSYQWVRVSGAAVTLSSSNTDTASFTAPSPGGWITLRCTATGTSGASNGLSGSALVTVRANTKPVVTAGSYSAVAGQNISINLASLVSDADGDGLVYTTTDALPVGATLSPAGIFTWAPAGAAGTYTFNLVANDSWQSSNPATVTLTVTPVAPSAGGGGSSTGLLGLLFLLSALLVSRRYPAFR
jgi:serine protease